MEQGIQKETCRRREERRNAEAGMWKESEGIRRRRKKEEKMKEEVLRNSLHFSNKR